MSDRSSAFHTLKMVIDFFAAMLGLLHTNLISVAGRFCNFFPPHCLFSQCVTFLPELSSHGASCINSAEHIVKIDRNIHACVAKCALGPPREAHQARLRQAGAREGIHKYLARSQKETLFCIEQFSWSMCLLWRKKYNLKRSCTLKKSCS